MSYMRMEFAPALMTKEVAAYYLSISERELVLMKNRGEFTAYGTGKRIFFKKSELDEYVDRMPVRDGG